MSLAGVATTSNPSAGMLSVDFSSLGFMAAVSSPSSAQSVTVKNLGVGAVMLSNIGTTGPFQVVNSSTGGCTVPQQLASGASCTLSVVFNAPATAGDSTGTLLVQGSGGESRSVGLSGRAMVTNAGGGNGDGDGKSGGGGVVPWALLALVLAAAALPARRREISNP
ncbi:hypothetical protein DBR42_12540 [Pelomonas sp. HMWF004]|nr:hypothetical protein DBR42_12540 [Pelomonas sp. HMWF004]